MVTSPDASRLADRPLTVGHAIEAGFRLWPATWRRVFLPALVANLIALVPALAMPQDDNPVVQFGQLMAWIRQPSVWLLYLLAIVGSTAGYAVVVYRLGLIGRGDDPGLAAAVRGGLVRTPGLLGTWLLVALLVLVSLLPLAAVIAAVLASARDPGALAVLLPIGGLLALAPILAAMVYSSVAVYASVLERFAPHRAVLRSFALVSGNFWRATAIWLVAAVVYIAAVSVVGLVVGAGAAVVTLATGGGQAMAGGHWALAAQVVMTPVQAAGLAYFYGAGLVLFNDLILRTDAAEPAPATA